MLAQSLIASTTAVATAPSAPAHPSAVSSAARWTRGRPPTAAATTVRAAGGSCVTQIRTSQAVTGSIPAAA